MNGSTADHTSLVAWQELWRELKLAGDLAAWYHRLVTAYTGPTRHYHNLQHIEECLEEVAQLTTPIRHSAQVRLALWFHDVVYDSHSAQNEEASADLASACLESGAASAETIAGVRDLVMCTKFHQAGTHPDGALVVDIDLAILGQSPVRFAAYEKGIRAEYEWVPASTFASKRAEILAGLLNRPGLYATASFRDRYETQARRNLACSVAALRANLTSL